MAVLDTATIHIPCGDDLTDNSVNSQDATAVGSPVTAIGPFGGADKATDLDGITQHLNIPSAPQLQAITGSLTLSIWVKPTIANGSIATNEYIVGNGSNPATRKIRLWRNNGGTIGFRLTQGASYPIVTVPDTLTVGSWNHIAVRRNGTTGAIKINIDNDPKTVSGSYTAVPLSAGAIDYSLGTQYTSAGTETFDGAIATFAMWDSELSDSEITELFNAPVPEYSLTYNLTPSTARWSVDAGSTWIDSGTSTNVPAGSTTITFEDEPYYVTPADETFTMPAETTVRTKTYTVDTTNYDLTYTLTPATALWSPDAGSNWYASGATVSLQTNPITVTFSDVTGYVTPVDETFALTANTSRSTTYAEEIDIYATGVQGRWILGDDITDQSVNSYDATAVNGPITSVTNFAGEVDKASDLNGTNQVFQILNAANINSISGDLTLACRINPDTIGTDETLFGNSSGVLDRCFELYRSAAGKILFYRESETFTQDTSIGDVTVPADSWTNVMVTFNQTTGVVKIYTNATSNTVTNGNGGTAPTNPGTADTFYIGGQDTTSRLFNGQISDMVVWNRVLSDYEAELYNAAPPGEIAVTNITDNYKFLRDTTTNSKTITIDFTFSGLPTAIEASFAGGAFTTIDAAPTGGSGSGTLVCPAGDGDLVVRFANATATTTTISDVGVGEVWITYGQSNAAGQGTNNQTYTGTQPAFMPDTGDTWKTLVDPTHGAGGSIWPLVASYVSDDEACPVYLLPAAVGGYKLVMFEAELSKPNIAYNSLVSTINTNNNFDNARMIFWGGESDLGATTAAYKTAMSKLIDDLQADTHLTGLQAQWFSIGNVGGVTSENAVRLAQQEQPVADSDIFFGGMINRVDLTGGDDVHFLTDAQLTYAAETCYYYLGINFFGNAGGIGPKYSSSIVEASNQIRVTFDVANGNLQGDATVGWRESDDTNAELALSVTSAVIENGNEILLTFDGDLGANPLLSYGYSEDATGSLLRDSASVPGLTPTNLGLSPEIFINEAVSPIPATDIDITPNVGTVNITGINPVIDATIDILPNAGNVNITGINPSISTGVTEITPNIGAVSITGINPAVTIGTIPEINIAPNVGTITILGINPSIRTGTLTRPPSNRVFIVPFN